MLISRMKAIKNNHGFSVVTMLLFFAVLGAICLAGWYVYDTNWTTDDEPVTQAANKKTQPEPQQETIKDDEQVGETEAWLTFKSDEIGIFFAYPDAWKVDEASPCRRGADAIGAECGVNLIYRQSTDKYPPTIAIHRLGKSFDELEAWYDKYYAQSDRNDVTKDDINVKGKPAIRYLVTNSGSLSKLYLIQSEDKVYEILTVDSLGARQLKDYMPTFDKVLDSLEITN
jgi:PsbP-like protein